MEGAAAPRSLTSEGADVREGAASRTDAIVDGRYRVLGELGRGGMGRVLLAEDQRLRRLVALKLLRPGALARDLERFRREARVLARLSNHHVVRLFDCGEHQGDPYLVMEFLEGRTLDAEIREAGDAGLPVDVALGFVFQLCDALSAVHRHGVIHRDVKPGNVMIAAGTRAVLMDFGLAREDGERDPGAVSGTPMYLAPEDIRGAPLAGAGARRSDLYALGVTLYEMLAGRPPFDARSTLEVLNQQLRRTPASLRELRPDLPAAVEAVMHSALAKDPEARPGSCEEFADALWAARYEGCLPWQQEDELAAAPLRT